jgi:hypothetical protein
MNLVKVFLLTMAAAVAGAAGGGYAGANVAPGGLLVGGFLLGTAAVIGSGYLAERVGWIRRHQRLWCILGGASGFAMAWVVTLATIMTPGAIIASTVLVGVGAVLGAVVGVSPHAEA